ncbi:hypothetical protein MPSI1_003088 [Malassezia psittaci]|uniref:Uncharacterized protein n=1 Tax=Malassezia psittaci TaxID=1821823 RepID=A0AAF0FBK0_9BASI|nr:hypothetical protein MPSI1_003088 [Malassezia psittaci]
MPFLEHFQRNKKPEESSTPERGRTMMGTGRGGAGNIRQSSLVREDDEQPEKEVPSIMHVGRGGVGNVRSPSRDPANRKREEQDENELDEMQDAELRNHIRVTGRGGFGTLPPAHEEERGRGRRPANTPQTRVAGLVRSLSRSRSREPAGARRESSTQQRLHLDQVAE